MNEKSTSSESERQSPAIGVGMIIKGLKSELDATFRTLERYSGVAYNTLQNWAAGEKANQIEALVRLLARIPTDARHHILDSACPCFPSLRHPYIARDRQVAASLSDLLRQSKGVTVVVSESDYLRSFVATALAHTFAAWTPNRLLVSGIDIHKPNWFVPVDGITYLGLSNRPEALEAAFRERQLKPARLMFLNGVYSRVLSVRSEAQKLSAASHVVIAERNGVVRDLSRFASPRNVVTVSAKDRRTESADDAAHMELDVRETAG